MPSKKPDSWAGKHVGLRGYARGVEVVGGVERAAGGRADAAILRLLLAEAFAPDGEIGGAEERLVGAFGDFYGGGGDAFDVGACDVVAEADGLPVAGGVVVDAFVGDAGEGDAGVDLQRRPGVEAGGDLVGEDIDGSPAAL